ncbi:prepilin peptidase [Vibrio ezurae]|uniref:prepilin peptidase n=1 Tax=Vibrio ezurae TaxID=252583 RepID=UPI00068FFC29
MTLLVICIEDIVKRTITNKSVFFVFIISCIVSLHEVNIIIKSFLILTVISLTVYKLNLWAGGDSKLLISLSPLFSPEQCMDVIVSILLCGGVLSVFYMVKNRFIYSSNVTNLPYGVAIIGGTNLSLYFFQGLAVYL